MNKNSDKQAFYKQFHNKIGNELDISSGTVVRLRISLLGEKLSKETTLSRAYESSEAIKEQLNSLKRSLSTWRQVIMFIDTATDKQWEILLQEEKEVL